MVHLLTSWPSFGITQEKEEKNWHVINACITNFEHQLQEEPSSLAQRDPCPHPYPSPLIFFSVTYVIGNRYIVIG